MAQLHPPQLAAWQPLRDHAEVMAQASNHLRQLLQDPRRPEDFSLSGGGLFYDFACQRINRETLALLYALADQAGIRETFRRMLGGGKVNTTENRAALHTACRDLSTAPIFLDGRDVKPDLVRVREEIRDFAAQVHSGRIAGAGGRPFAHVVVIGIGGSYLGTEFVATALAAWAQKGIRLHFLANVDIDNFGSVAAAIDPETTLWVVISKSYTTPETAANAALAAEFMQSRGLDPSRHLVTVTSQGSPGDDPANPVLKTFHMFDYIGGRYSVSSAVGGVPLSLLLGYERFVEFLEGAEEMDRHAADADPRANLPLTAALIAIWNNNFLGYPARAVIPYADALRKLAAHVQQLNMESNGKAVTTGGEPPAGETGVLIFGEPGTNAQHSFFQLAHQGRPLPIEFIGVLRPHYSEFQTATPGVSNHQELWANLLSQPLALAQGRSHVDPARRFPGNRPSSTLLLEDLSPRNVGRLLAFYEAQTVFEAFVWGINPFDQFGVELGKTMASGIRAAMAARNRDPEHTFRDQPRTVQVYLNALFHGRLPQT
jgi:glucose-6-phosphate isomerase